MANQPESTDTKREKTSTRPRQGRAPESPRSTGSGTTEHAREEADRLVDKGKKHLAGRAEEQKKQASKRLEDLGAALRDTSDTLQENDQDSIAGVTKSVADQVERLSGYLQDRSVNDMISEAEQFARREPGMFLGGAALLGLIGARFFKSSPQQEPRQHRRRRTPVSRSSHRT